MYPAVVCVSFSLKSISSDCLQAFSPRFTRRVLQRLQCLHENTLSDRIILLGIVWLVYTYDEILQPRLNLSKLVSIKVYSFTTMLNIQAQCIVCNGRLQRKSMTVSVCVCEL